VLLSLTDFFFEVVDDPALGRGDEVRVANRDTDHDADGEREQDGRERERVIAEVEQGGSG